MNTLIVEGYIDGATPTSFKLSRSRILTWGDTATRHYEVNARVLVEDDHQGVFPLAESGNGVYTSNDILALHPSYQYRLHIYTSDGKEYLSEMVPFKQSPAIDTIGWKLQDGGVQVYVNTHDASNATRYYRWEYNETWEFHTRYLSNIRYISGTYTIVPRTEPVQICWQTDNSTGVLIGSSAKLTNDVISEMPLVYFPEHDNKLSVLYSIRVKQTVLDVNGYNYYVALRNNTERVGSIFDPQPNQNNGNIHCVTDTAERVIGYINAGNSVATRIYISNSALPPNWNIYDDCPIIDVPNIPDSLEYYFGGGWDPINKRLSPANVLYYTGSYAECVDCTLHGTNVKPLFWP